MLETLGLYFGTKKVRYWHRHLLWIVRGIRFFLPLLCLLGVYMWKTFRHAQVDMFALFTRKGKFLSGYQLAPWWVFVLIPVVWCMVCIGWEILLEKGEVSWHFRRFHLQQLSRMIVDNGWVERGTKKGRGRVTGFPNMFYRMKKGTIFLWVENAMGRHQSQFLSLQQKVETGLFCELMEMEVGERYIRYRFLYNLKRCRIGLEQVVCKNGSLLLMEGVSWEFDKQPHALIVGGIGGGKSYFILTLIESLLKDGADVRIMDPKRADLSDLGQVMPFVYSQKEDIISKIIQFYFEMLDTYDRYKHMPGYYTGCNYRDVGLPPHFLIFDEYVAFMDMLGYSTADKVMTYLRKIAMLGRQAGYFLILACQRPDAKYFGDGMRDQFHLRVAFGRNSEMGYSMIFGSEVKKQFFNRGIRGRGYVDLNTGIVHEFYSPLVPKGYDFLGQMGKLGLSPTVPIPRDEYWTLERGAEEEENLGERTQRVLAEMGVYPDQGISSSGEDVYGDMVSHPDDLDSQIETSGMSLRHLRESLGLSQSECAERLGISRPHLSDYENGRRLTGKREKELFDQMKKWMDS